MENLYFKDCFTEIEEGKINSKFNKTTMKCFESEDNSFSMDCEGNLVVNSLITRNGNNSLEFNIDSIYPIGSIYLSVLSANPENLFGGSWEQLRGRFLLGCGENDGNTTDYWGNYNEGACNYPNGEKGGEVEHLLTINELPEHNHQLIKYVPYGIPYNDTTGNSLGSSGKVNYGESYEPFAIGHTGGNKVHNNMPPYLAVYMWKRVA